jgi:hypothetical protein
MNTFLDELTDHVLSIQLKDHPPFARPLQWVFFPNGSTSQDGSLMLFGFENEKPNPTLAVKVSRLLVNDWMLQNEYDRLVELWARLGDEAVYRLPQPLAMVSIKKQPTLITTYLKGVNLLRASQDAVWDNPKQMLALAVDVAQSLRDVMDRTATKLLMGEQVPSDFKQKVEKFIQMYQITNLEKQAIAEVMNDIEIAKAQADHKILLQGDFWHGNMIRGEEYGRLMFIDWQYSRWATDVSLDLYFFLLAGSLASVQSASLADRARKAVRILLKWQAKIIPAYLAAFGKPDKYALLPIRSGMLMCCIENAVRASIDIGHDQVEDVVWRFMFSELMSWPDGQESYV